MSKVIYETTLTGTKMSQYSKVAERIKPGTCLSIWCRPDNQFDNFAMSVHFGSSVTDPQVGWIPNKQIEDSAVKMVLNRLVAHGIPLHAVVSQHDAARKEITVDVCLTESAEPTGSWFYNADESGGETPEGQ